MTTGPESPERPHSPEPMSARGAELLAGGSPLEAVEALRQGVAAGEPSAPDLLVEAYAASGSWSAAAEWLTSVVEQGHVRFAGRLGAALAEIGDDERAEAALRLAVDSGDVAAANDLAILLSGGDRPGEAVQVLVRAAEEGDPQARANLVALHLEDGDLSAAVDAAERYADEGRPDTVVALAEVRSVQGRDGEADGLYRRAVELGGLRAHTAYGLFLWTTRGDAAGAEREFREAGRRDEPGWADTLGRFLLEDGRPDEARDYLQVAVEEGDRGAAATLADLDDDNRYD